MSVQFIKYEGSERSWEPEQYVGAVLDTFEMNGHDDSDYYAIVWDDEKQAVTTVMYDTTRFGAMGRASVDATPEVKQKAYAYATKVMSESMIKDFKIVAPGMPVRAITWGVRG